MRNEAMRTDARSWNERLLAVMQAAHITSEELAKLVVVTPKTVSRWTHQGQVPYPRNRRDVAMALEADQNYLWPPADDQLAMQRRAEVVGHYANRAEMPAQAWSDALAGARQRILILVYAGLIFFETTPRLIPTLKSAADAGVEVRLLLGDPESEAVVGRGREEGSEMAFRVRSVLKVLEPIIGYQGIDVRTHESTLYNSLYVFDNTMFANTHIIGRQGGNAPFIHLRRTAAGYLFDMHLEGFEKVWALGRKLERDR